MLRTCERQLQAANGASSRQAIGIGLQKPEELQNLVLTLLGFGFVWSNHSLLLSYSSHLERQCLLCAIICKLIFY
jgi:hypothetical protein